MVFFSLLKNHDPPCWRKNCAEAKARLNEWLGEEDYNTMTLMMIFFLVMLFICSSILERWDERDDWTMMRIMERMSLFCMQFAHRTPVVLLLLVVGLVSSDVGSAEGLQNKRGPSLTMIIKTIKSSCIK